MGTQRHTGDQRIRTALDRVSNAWADLGERVAEAYRRRADLALGYASWAEYAERELKPSAPLAAEVRRELVAMLSAQGMSTRAIGSTVGVSHKTIVKDRQVVPDVPPASESSFGFYAPSEPIVAEPALTTDALPELPESAYYVPDDLTVDEHQPEPPKTVGLDGKSYTRSAPKPTGPTRRGPTRSLGRRLAPLPARCRWMAHRHR